MYLHSRPDSCSTISNRNIELIEHSNLQANFLNISMIFSAIHAPERRNSTCRTLYKRRVFQHRHKIHPIQLSTGGKLWMPLITWACLHNLKTNIVN